VSFQKLSLSGEERMIDEATGYEVMPKEVVDRYNDLLLRVKRADIILNTLAPQAHKVLNTAREMGLMGVIRDEEMLVYTAAIAYGKITRFDSVQSRKEAKDILKGLFMDDGVEDGDEIIQWIDKNLQD
jgi:hypothetical protein